MANPFTAPTLSSYNASPPSDDGSATEANTIEWSKHIDKIGDPLKTYAQAISSGTSTAFGKVFGADFAEKTANYTIAASDQGKVIVSTTADLTFTLPAVGSLGTNWCMVVQNQSSGTLTIDGNSSETIDGDTTFTLAFQGSYAIIVTNGTSFRSLRFNAVDESVQWKTLSADSDKASTTTVASESDLSGFTVTAGETYLAEAYLTYTQNGGDIKARLYLNGASASNHKTSWGLATSQSNDAERFLLYVNASAETPGTDAVTTMTDTDQATIVASTVFVPGAGATTLDFEWAQNSSASANTSILKGSSIRLSKIAAI